MVAIVSAAVLAFAAGYELLSMLLVAIALYVARAVRPEEVASNAPALVCSWLYSFRRILTQLQTLDALNELISAGNVWDSVINEAMSLIEKEERRYFIFLLVQSRVANNMQSKCVLQPYKRTVAPPQP